MISYLSALIHIRILLLQVIKHQSRIIKELESRVFSSSSRDDADSGVVCTDNTDNDVNDVTDEDQGGTLRHSDSVKTVSDTGGYTYSRRVYLNHRNITKMKDIKYKRITKTKSKSMEELRDKLRDSPFPLDKEDPGFSYA